MFVHLSDLDLRLATLISSGVLADREQPLAREILEKHGEDVFAAFLTYRTAQLQQAAETRAAQRFTHRLHDAFAKQRSCHVD